MTDSLRVEPYTGHRCRCLLTDGTDQDRCSAWVTSPDQPVCDRCERQGHGPGVLGDLLRGSGLHFDLAP